MNQDLQLKLQAFLDGELPNAEVNRVADWIDSDPEAQALLFELRTTKVTLRENELPHAVPETRDFYWSKINRAIESAERLESRPAPHFITLWRRFMAPLAGVALVTFLTLSMVHYFKRSQEDPYLSHLAEVETPSDDVGAYSFRSPSGNMFVVWLYDRSSNTMGDGDFYDEL
ncbi:MAG TPA: hypothetical protein VK633_07170 [Verrucomicrobiae bacterium]|nr:hypothetical protein [Verrucomicrobiae bacterium]